MPALHQTLELRARLLRRVSVSKSGQDVLDQNGVAYLLPGSDSHSVVGASVERSEGLQ